MADSGHQTKIIVGFSLASGAAGLLPVLDRQAIIWLRQQMLLVLSRRYDMPLDGGAALTLAGAAQLEPGALAVGALIVAAGKGLLGARLKAVLKPLRFAKRAADVSESFVLGSYFEYYIRTYHPSGEGLYDAVAERLRGALEGAGGAALGAAATGVVGSALAQAVDMVVSAPKALWALTSTALAKGDEAAEEIIETDASGFFARAAKRVEAGFSEAGNAAVTSFFESFAHAWEASDSK